MTKFDELATDIAQRQYMQPGETTVEDVFRRAVDAVVPDDDAFAARMYDLMVSKKFCPGGRILAGAGTEHGNLQNCYVQDGSPHEPGTTEYALHLAKKLAVVTKVGGGNGVNLDSFPARSPSGYMHKPRVYLLTNGDPDLTSGTFLNLVTGERETRGYRTLIADPADPSPLGAKTLLVEDSVEGIWDAADEMVQRTLDGYSTVIDLSRLRPEGSPVKGSGGTSSGPASFAVEIFDNFATWAYLGGAEYAGPVATLRYLFAPTLRVIRQGGVRRGAGMATLSATHPDLYDFLTAKALEREKAEGDISTFNISVLASDVFMVMPEWERQRELIAQQAWSTGEPGLLFVDTINRHNLMFEVDGPIMATNPCLTGDAMVLTVNGPRRFDDLARTEADVDVWAIDVRTNEPVISTMRRPHLTRTDAEVLRVEFDSGLVIHATPDHNFFTLHRNRVKAKDLTPGQSVSAFVMHQHRDGQLRVLRNQKDTGTVKQWFVHRLIYDHYHGIPEGMVIHHLDGDPTNNDLSNLATLTPTEHNRVHYPERAAAGFDGYSPNHKVVSVTPAGTADVYNGMVERYHNYVVVDPTPIGKSFLSGILSANCGEIGLYPGEPCDLGAMNIAAYVDEDGLFDWDGFELDVAVALEYLDRVLDVTVAPLPEIREAIDDKRRIGLGMMGLGDALIKLGIPFDEDDAVGFATNIASLMAEVALGYTETAEEYSSTGPLRAGFKRNNVALLTVAPTGTTAMLFGVTSGIEPLFAPFIYRRVGTEYKQILHPLFKEVMERYSPTPYFCTWEPHPDMEGAYRPGKWDWNMVTAAISKHHGSVQGIVGIPQSVQDLFRCAHDIAPEDHIEIQGAVQRGFDYAGNIPASINKTFVGNSISKTINFGNKVHPSDILEAMALAWRIGCKGVTVYRDGSRDLQVLNTSLQEDDGSDVASQRADQLDEIVAASCSVDGTCDI